jgi:hypothetical protein
LTDDGHTACSWSGDGRSIFAALGEAERDVALLEGLR